MAAGILAVLVVVAYPLPSGAVMYGANCRTGLTQWSQEPDADGRHQRLTAPIPIDEATRAWSETEAKVAFETVPIELEDGRFWYRLRAIYPGMLSTGDDALLDAVELGP